MEVEKLITYINTLALLILGFMEWSNRRRQINSQSEVGEADAANKITNSATALVQSLQTELSLLRPLVGRVALLESEINNVRKANERLIYWAERLVQQIESAGLEPVPFRVDAESDRIKTLPVERPIK